jgi:hypothetical protein
MPDFISETHDSPLATQKAFPQKRSGDIRPQTSLSELAELNASFFAQGTGRKGDVGAHNLSKTAYDLPRASKHVTAMNRAHFAPSSSRERPAPLRSVYAVESVAGAVKETNKASYQQSAPRVMS